MIVFPWKKKLLFDNFKEIIHYYGTQEYSSTVLKYLHWNIFRRSGCREWVHEKKMLVARARLT